jgi:dTMP kinase
MNRGKLITVEGMDGAGKSSHVQWIADALRARGHEVIETREPGGTPLGEALRAMLLNQSMDVETETLLMFAARREHIVKVIEPALGAGHWVVSDRFTDATYAYQGGGRGVPTERIAELESWVHQGLQPDLTLVFDVPVEVARARLGRLSAGADRFENQDAAFFDRVRRIYLERARASSERMRIVDASGTFEDVRFQLEKYLLRV